MRNVHDVSTERDLVSRVHLVTGANTGIGLVTARELARRGARVFVVCRTMEKAAVTAEAIRREAGNELIEPLALDLSRLASVRACAEAFLRRDEPLHVLINNAGLAGRHGVTADGFEIAFGVNHLGHFLLTVLLLERMGQSAPSRVVTVASKAHFRAKAIDLDAVRGRTRSLTGIQEYAVSKACNVLFSAELARRTAGGGVTCYSLHPGVVASDIWRNVPWPVRPLMRLRRMLPVEEGAGTTLYCATSPEVAEQSGLYYDACKVKTPSELASDASLAEELWNRSDEWTDVQQCERAG